MSDKRGLRVEHPFLQRGRGDSRFSYRSAEEIRRAQAELEAGEAQGGDPVEEIFRQAVLSRYQRHPGSER